MGQAIHTCLVIKAGEGNGGHTGQETEGQVPVFSLVLRNCMNLKKLLCLIGPHS